MIHISLFLGIQSLEDEILEDSGEDLDQEIPKIPKTSKEGRKTNRNRREKEAKIKTKNWESNLRWKKFSKKMGNWENHPHPKDILNPRKGGQPKMLISNEGSLLEL
jgi:hypothetical protein